MKRFFSFILHELREMVFPAIFFLLVFHLISLSKSLLFDSYNVSLPDTAIATVSALIAAKAVLIAEALPFFHWLHRKPFLPSLIWKTTILWLLFAIIRLAEELIKGWIKLGTPGDAWRELLEGTSLPYFIAVQIWLVFVLLIFTFISELDLIFGKGTIKRALLGDPTIKHPADTPPVAADSVIDVSNAPGDAFSETTV